MTQPTIYRKVENDCPICKGTGKLERPKFSDSQELHMVFCHACNGSGKISDYEPVSPDEDVSDEAILQMYPSSEHEAENKAMYNRRKGARQMRDLMQAKIEAMNPYLQHTQHCAINQNWSEAEQAFADTPSGLRDTKWETARNEMYEKMKTCTCGLHKLTLEIQQP